MRFRWDPAKDRSNQAKHGIAFDAAVAVFADPLAITKIERIVEGEERWQTIGIAVGIIILLVAHTVEDSDGEEIVRIISARRATRTERREYEENRAKAR